MPSDLSQRILRLEMDIQAIDRELAQLLDLVGQLRQQQYEPGGGASGGGGAGATVFYADHLSMAALTGTTTGDVYKLNGGSPVLVQAGATIYNILPDAT